MGTFLALLIIGVIAGLRTMTAPAAVSWAARLGWLELGQTNLAFLGYALPALGKSPCAALVRRGSGDAWKAQHQ